MRSYSFVVRGLSCAAIACPCSKAAIEQVGGNAGGPEGVAVSGSAERGIAATFFDHAKYILTGHAAIAEAAPDMRILFPIHFFGKGAHPTDDWVHWSADYHLARAE